MLAFIVGVCGTFFRFLAGVLPESPFGSIVLAEQLDTALGWLNWVVPVGDMLTLMGVWLTALIAAFVIKVVIQRAFGAFSAVAK